MSIRAARQQARGRCAFWRGAPARYLRIAVENPYRGTFDQGTCGTGSRFGEGTQKEIDRSGHPLRDGIAETGTDKRFDSSLAAGLRVN